MRDLLRIRWLLMFVTLAVLFVVPTTTGAQVTTPMEELGVNIGDDYNLFTYTQFEAYWRKLAEESPRMILEEARIHPAIREKIASNHRDIVEEVASAVDRDPIVVVGMAQNPVCKKAKKYLKEAGHAFTYLEYGSYLSTWRRRNALKQWTGWPTFPMVFIRGTLVGGADAS